MLWKTPHGVCRCFCANSVRFIMPLKFENFTYNATTLNRTWDMDWVVYKLENHMPITGSFLGSLKISLSTYLFVVRFMAFFNPIMKCTRYLCPLLLQNVWKRNQIFRYTVVSRILQPHQGCHTWPRMTLLNTVVLSFNFTSKSRNVSLFVLTWNASFVHNAPENLNTQIRSS
jgi:hypothetical protein